MKAQSQVQEGRIEEKRGVLWLAGGAMPRPGQGEVWRRVELPPGEERTWLTRARCGLRALRSECGWICVAADGAGAGLAAALAAQLPVERLALTNSNLFERGRLFERGALARLTRFARRNLALVAAEVVLMDAGERELRGFAQALGGRRLCALSGNGRNFLTAPWAEINENNLLLAGKCV